MFNEQGKIRVLNDGNEERVGRLIIELLTAQSEGELWEYIRNLKFVLAQITSGEILEANPFYEIQQFNGDVSIDVISRAAFEIDRLLPKKEIIH